jgi:hypothetical protein
VTRNVEYACYLTAAMCVAAGLAGYPVAVVGLFGLFIAGCARRRTR